MSSPSFIEEDVGANNFTTDISRTAELSSSSPQAVWISVTRWLWTIWPPIALAGGTFGNICTIIMLGPEATRKGGTGRGSTSTINVYLVVLAISDLVALYLGLLRYWIFEWLLYELYSHWLVCKVAMWLWSAAWSNSTYLLVSLTLQRGLSVVWPHRVRLVCTRKATIGVIVVTAVLSLALFSHIAYGYDVVFMNTTSYLGLQCVLASEAYSDFMTKIFTPMGIALHAVIPFVVLMASNIILGHSLMSSVSLARKTLSSGAHDQQVQSRKRKASSTTLTVIAISVAFFLLNLPLFVFTTVSSRNLDTQALAYEAGVAVFLPSFLLILVFTNFAVNFYLYILSGSRFRKQFFEMIQCCGNADGNGVMSGGSVKKAVESSSVVFTIDED